MVTSVATKVNRLLEATGGDGGGCLRCGWGGGGDGNDDTYEVVWIDSGEPDDGEEFCEECGRQLVYVITWGDEAS
jgi:hypothetical protein